MNAQQDFVTLREVKQRLERLLCYYGPVLGSDHPDYRMLEERLERVARTLQAMPSSLFFPTPLAVPPMRLPPSL